MTTRNLPRPSAFERGQMAARTLGTLKGLPYGPGPRQDDFLRGFEEAKLELAHTDDRTAA